MTRLQRTILLLLIVGLAVLAGTVTYQMAALYSAPPLPAAPPAAALAMLSPTANHRPTMPPTWTPTVDVTLLTVFPGMFPTPVVPEPTSTPTTFPLQPNVTLPPTWTPTPTATPTPIPSPTPTPTPVPTHTPQPTPTSKPSAHPRPTLVPLLATPTQNPSSTFVIPTPVAALAIPDNAITVVLLGSDQRPDWKDWHTDAIQYVVIYPDVPAVAMLSIPRDLYVYIPDFWMSRINCADMYGVFNQYAGGGLGLLNQTMLYNLGISADYYVKVNFDGLIGLVDALGGVDIPVYCRLEDYWPYPNEQGEYPWLVLEPGMYHMDGEHALWYSRTRKTTSVFSRERRQQEVLEAIWRKAHQTDLVRAAPALYDQTRHLYETDMDLGTLFSLAVTAMQLDSSDIYRYNLGREQVTPYTTEQGGAVFLPVWEQIQPLLTEVLTPPSTSRATHAPIPVEIWNGTGHADWDQLAWYRLARYGYAPTIGTPEQPSYPETQIIYFDSNPKGSGLTLVQTLFKVKPENMVYQPDPNASVRLRLILGTDYNPCQ